MIRQLHLAFSADDLCLVSLAKQFFNERDEESLPYNRSHSRPQGCSIVSTMTG
jgi:hypothetical protein